MTIAIIGAMSEEISAVQSKLANTTHRRLGSVDFYEGHFGGANILLVRSGVGKVHAALATTLAIQCYTPICIINIGTLGALRTHLKPATIILSESMLYHDVDVTAFNYVHGQLPKMPRDFQSSHKLLQLFEQLALKQNLPFCTGLGLTGDQFVNCGKKLEDIKEKFPTALSIDMESAAIAHVTHLFEIPFVAVRAVTDHADENANTISDMHLSSASDTAGNLVLSAIEEIAAQLYV